jgi:hypothetical protein
MLPYVRIIAVHIIPSVFKASNIRDRPPSTVLGWRSPQTLWGSRLENILYAGIGGPPQVAASFKPHRPCWAGTKGADVRPDFDWDKKPAPKETAPAR